MRRAEAVQAGNEPSFQEGGRYRNYAIVRLLGDGGMSSVWLAEHALTHRKVAIKVMKPATGPDAHLRDPVLLERFRREAAILCDLVHPNLPTIHDMDIGADGTGIIVMEYLEGRDLEQILRDVRRLSVPDALYLAVEIVRTLVLTHAHGIVHRDLKPANVFVCKSEPAEGKGRVRLLDFGVAWRSAGTGGRLTHENSIMGTVSYMSPEQLVGRYDDIDGRSDLYALGLLIYHALMGHPLFIPNVHQMPAAGILGMWHMQREPPSVREARPDVSEAFWLFIKKLLAKDPRDRHASAAEVLEELNTLLRDSLERAPSKRSFFAPVKNGARDAPRAPATKAPPAPFSEEPGPIKKADAVAAAPTNGAHALAYARTEEAEAPIAPAPAVPVPVPASPGPAPAVAPESSPEAATEPKNHSEGKLHKIATQYLNDVAADPPEKTRRGLEFALESTDRVVRLIGAYALRYVGDFGSALALQRAHPNEGDPEVREHIEGSIAVLTRAEKGLPPLLPRPEPAPRPSEPPSERPGPSRTAADQAPREAPRSTKVSSSPGRLPSAPARPLEDELRLRVAQLLNSSRATTPAETRAVLERALDHADAVTRLSAASALKIVGDALSARALHRALAREASPVVHARIEEAIAVLDPEGIGCAPLAAQAVASDDPLPAFGSLFLAQDRLVLLSGSSSSESCPLLPEYTLGPGRWTLGRSGAMSIIVEHDEVSRVHAELVWRSEGRYEVRDLDSSNGITVNRAPVKSALLEPGDHLALADVVEFGLARAGERWLGKAMSARGPVRGPASQSKSTSGLEETRAFSGPQDSGAGPRRRS